MAPKKEHSNDLRTLVIKHYQNDKSPREIAAKTLLPRSSVQYIVDKYKSTKCIGNLFGRDRKRKTAARADRLIQQIALRIDTIRKQSHEIRPFGRVARKKPYVNKITREKRLKFAKEMLQKPVDFWKNVVWSDESKFNLFGSDGKVMVWRTRREEFDRKCTVPTVKHGGGSVIVWAVSPVTESANYVY
ncbi:unnamed protein product [Rotaria socialis]|uniref:Transposase n=1 Tax=Rotaria socialis TaxID=392032 RepID=A0A819BSA8_9BILA|nr:unnamed protein product [Rotaria socialis]CAF4683916.1 unnamed protein product [Rotaria socialis]